MKPYDLIYLISPELSEEELRSLQEKIHGEIQKENGVLNEAKNILKKKLAYPIRKKEVVFFGFLNFSLPPEKIEILEKMLRAESQILRYFISIKKTAKFLPPRRKRTPLSTRIISSKNISETPGQSKEKKVELKEFDEKLEEILKD